MSGTKSDEEQYQNFQHRLEEGPQFGDYTPGSPSEYYEPATIITPATSIGQPGSIYSYEVLTDDEARPQYEDTNP